MQYTLCLRYLSQFPSGNEFGTYIETNDTIKTIGDIINTCNCDHSELIYSNREIESLEQELKDELNSEIYHNNLMMYQNLSDDKIYFYLRDKINYTRISYGRCELIDDNINLDDYRTIRNIVNSFINATCNKNNIHPGQIDEIVGVIFIDIFEKDKPIAILKI